MTSDKDFLKAALADMFEVLSNGANNIQIQLFRSLAMKAFVDVTEDRCTVTIERQIQIWKQRSKEREIIKEEQLRETNFIKAEQKHGAMKKTVFD